MPVILNVGVPVSYDRDFLTFKCPISLQYKLRNINMFICGCVKRACLFKENSNMRTSCISLIPLVEIGTFSLEE